MNFAQNLRELRLEHGMSQKELAEKIGLTKSAVSFWEANINEPKISHVEALSKLFGVSIEELIGGAKIVRAENISTDKQRLLKLYNDLNDKYKDIILTTMELYAKQSKEERKNK